MVTVDIDLGEIGALLLIAAIVWKAWSPILTITRAFTDRIARGDGFLLEVFKLKLSMEDASRAAESRSSDLPPAVQLERLPPQFIDALRKRVGDLAEVEGKGRAASLTKLARHAQGNGKISREVAEALIQLDAVAGSPQLLRIPSSIASDIVTVSGTLLDQLNQGEPGRPTSS